MRLFFEVDIGCDPATVFSWIADPDRVAIWRTSVAGGEIVDRKARKVGTTFRAWVEEGDGGVEMLGYVTAYEPDRRLSLHLASLLHELDVEYRLEQADGGVRLAVTTDLRWKFPISLVGPIVGRSRKKRIEAQSNEEFAWLKQLCEGSRAGEALAASAQPPPSRLFDMRRPG
jgi:uncharacterized protein YndB with AHSA1/START domain